MLEKTFVNQEFSRWTGNIPVEYLYTAGLAGEKFFNKLKTEAKIAGTSCPKCRLDYLPPRLFCERCFDKLTRWKNTPTKGYVFSYTINHIDLDGNISIAPTIIALIKFKGFHGGIIHKLDELTPAEVQIGMAITPIFEEAKKRQGNINDIKYFKPV